MMNDVSGSLGQLITLAMEVETKAYDFYDRLEKKFSDNEQFVSCVSHIKQDELLHFRILTEIKQSLSEHRLATPVPEETVAHVRKVLTFLDELDLEAMADIDAIIDAIRTLEEVEFDVVMVFVDAEEIDFQFTREYLKNESLDHSNRTFLAQQCLMD